MGTTRTERADDAGGCGGEDRGLWGKGGRLSPHNRASSRGDSRLSRGDRSGSDRDGSSGGRRDKEGANGQCLGSSLPVSNAQATPKIVHLSDTPAPLRDYATPVTDKGTP